MINLNTFYLICKLVYIKGNELEILSIVGIFSKKLKLELHEIHKYCGYRRYQRMDSK